MMKQTLEEIYQRHMTDDGHVIKRVMPLKDLSAIIYEYLVSEEDFEIELLALNFFTRKRHRIAHLLMNCRNRFVKRWLASVRQLLMSFYKHTDFHRALYTSLMLDRAPCNRLWCWYHQDVDGEVLRDYEECSCPEHQRITLDFMQTEPAKAVIKQFPPELTASCS